MGSFGTAFKQFFTAFTTMCAVFESIAQMLLNFAKVGEEESKAVLDKSQHDRAVAQAKLTAELLAPPTSTTP